MDSQTTSKSRKRSTSAAIRASDPQKAFSLSVERLKQRLETCAKMRTFGEMKASLEDVAELLRFFLAGTNELAGLYLNSVVFHSFLLGALQLLIKKTHKRDAQMFSAALEMLFDVLDKYESSDFFRQDQRAFAKQASVGRDPRNNLPFSDIHDELRDITERVVPFADDSDESPDELSDEESDDEGMDLDERYSNEPVDKKDYFETFLVAILPEMKEHLMTTFRVRELVARSVSGGETEEDLTTNRSEVNNFLNTSVESEMDEEADEMHDGIGLISRQFRMPPRDDLSIRYMAHVFKLIFFYFRNVNTDTLLQTRFAKVALLIVTNQRCFSRSFAYKIVRTFLKNGRKDGIDFDLPNSLIGYLLKNFLNDELDQFAAKLQVNENLKQFLACLNKTFIRELVGILNFVEFLDRPLWSFRIVANVKQSLDRLYESLKQAIKLLIGTKDSMDAESRSLSKAFSADSMALMLVQCLRGTAMIVNKLKDFYPCFEEAFEIMKMLMGLVERKDFFFSRNEVEFKKVFYQFVCILINERAITMNVFMYEYWPKLKAVWQKDISAESQPVNGSLLLVSRFCKSLPDYDEVESLAEVVDSFYRSSESRPMVLDSLNAVFEVISACAKITANSKCHSPTCQHAIPGPAFDGLKETARRLLDLTLERLTAMSVSGYFQICVGFYKRIFESKEYATMFGTDMWIPHVKLMFRRIDEVHNQKSIEELRNMFSSCGAGALLVILSGIIDHVLEEKMYPELEKKHLANFVAVIKIVSERQKSKRIIKRIAKLDAHFGP